MQNQQSNTDWMIFGYHVDIQYIWRYGPTRLALKKTQRWRWKGRSAYLAAICYGHFFKQHIHEMWIEFHQHSATQQPTSVAQRLLTYQGSWSGKIKNSRFRYHRVRLCVASAWLAAQLVELLRSHSKFSSPYWKTVATHCLSKAMTYSINSWGSSLTVFHDIQQSLNFFVFNWPDCSHTFAWQSKTPIPH